MSEYSDLSSSSMNSSVSSCNSSTSSRSLTPNSISSSEGISPRSSFADYESSGRDESLNSPTSEDDKRRIKISRSNRAKRTSFYAYQLSGLGQVFDKEQYPDPVQRQKIADALDLDFDTVTRWFQNRRAKFRRDSSSCQRKSQQVQSSEETPTKPQQGTGSSSFHMEAILRKSPPSEKKSTAFKSKVAPIETSVNSYYQYYPYYYPAYVYHYYPNVKAHCHSPVSMASEHPILRPVDKPLDLSCSKKRESQEREVKNTPNKKKRRCSEEKREAAAALFDLSRQTPGRDDTDTKTTEKKQKSSPQLNISPFPNMYSSAYYRSYPFHPVYRNENRQKNETDAGYVPMTSMPLNSVYASHSPAPNSR